MRTDMATSSLLIDGSWQEARTVLDTFRGFNPRTGEACEWTSIFLQSNFVVCNVDSSRSEIHIQLA